MDCPKLIVSNQKEESISIQRVNLQLVSPVMDFRSFYMFFLIKKFRFRVSLNIFYCQNIYSNGVGS